MGDMEGWIFSRSSIQITGVEEVELQDVMDV